METFARSLTHSVLRRPTAGLSGSGSLKICGLQQQQRRSLHGGTTVWRASLEALPHCLRARLSYHGGSLGPGACGGRDREGGLVSLQFGRVHFREGGGGVPTELLEER